FGVINLVEHYLYLAFKGFEIDTSKDGNLDDNNDVPMEENQVVGQDLNESTLDLSLGLNAHDSNHNSKADHIDC
ncbi:hypothetical protein F8388_027292, partial [Cannabis sativa]